MVDGLAMGLRICATRSVAVIEDLGAGDDEAAWYAGCCSCCSTAGLDNCCGNGDCAAGVTEGRSFRSITICSSSLSSSSWASVIG